MRIPFLGIVIGCLIATLNSDILADDLTIDTSSKCIDKIALKLTEKILPANSTKEIRDSIKDKVWANLLALQLPSELIPANATVTERKVDVPKAIAFFSELNAAEVFALGLQSKEIGVRLRCAIELERQIQQMPKDALPGIAKSIMTYLVNNETDHRILADRRIYLEGASLIVVSSTVIHCRNSLRLIMERFQATGPIEKDISGDSDS
jgi:hypothetical protein